MHKSSRTRVGVLVVVGGLLGVFVTYRRRALTRHAEEFHQRYG